jgi:hypothetical protein
VGCFVLEHWGALSFWCGNMLWKHASKAPRSRSCSGVKACEQGYDVMDADGPRTRSGTTTIRSEPAWESSTTCHVSGLALLLLALLLAIAIGTVLGRVGHCAGAPS